MTIERQIYDSSQLLAVMREVDSPSSYWLDKCFPGTFMSDDEYIDVSLMDRNKRKLAPLVVPTSEGKPIYSRAERMMRLKPAYLKPKDPVTPHRMLKRQQGLNELMAARPLTPAQRYAAIIADIGIEHRDAIMRWWEWNASQAIQHGKVTLEDDGYPTAIVDFGRDPNHTITLAPGAQWTNADVSILGQIGTWASMMRQASFGGAPNSLVIGAKAWDAMRNNKEIRELLKVDYRPSNGGIQIALGMRSGLEVENVGRLSGTLDVDVYSDYYHDKSGQQQLFMDPRDIVLVGPAVNGVKAFGAILDTKAGLQPIPIFPKMWDSEDPSATFVMTQSSPLMFPLNPNATLRARVVA